MTAHSASPSEQFTELATIAREAEANAAERIDRCYQSEERALKAEAERDALLAPFDDLRRALAARKQVNR